MKLLDKLKKYFAISLLEMPTMPVFGQLDSYPLEIIREYEEDKQKWRERNEKH